MTMVLVGLLFFASVSGTGNAVVRAGGEGSCIISCECWSAGVNGYPHGEHNHTLCGYLSGTTGTAYVGTKFTVRPVSVHGLTNQTYSISWVARTRSNAYVGGGSFSNVCCVDGTYDANSGNTVSFSDPSLDPLLDDHAGCWGKFKVTIAAITATGGNCCHESMTFEFKVAYWPLGPRNVSTDVVEELPLSHDCTAHIAVSYVDAEWVAETATLEIVPPAGSNIGYADFDDPMTTYDEGRAYAAFYGSFHNGTQAPIQWTAIGTVTDDYGASDDTITFWQSGL